MGKVDGDSECAEEPDCQTGVRLMFEKFDTDHDGLLSKQHFVDILLQLGCGDKFESDELDTIADAADTDSDGYINLHEFSNWIFSTGVGNLADGISKERADPTEQRSDKLHALEEKNRALEAELAELQRKVRHMEKAEAKHDIEMENIAHFWRQISKTSASPVLGNTVDLNTLELLGNGRYGFVLKCSRRSEDGGDECREDRSQQPVVVKLLSFRWAHVAAREWAIAQLVGDHPYVLGSEDTVLLHADADKMISKVLHAAQEAGKLQMKKRAEFPDRWMCLLQEYMNRGTVQLWMDEERLAPGGMLVTLQRVGEALAYMHKNGVTHNDIKPENILLKQDGADPKAEVAVKLGDLGLAERSSDRSADHWQFGMTALCMATGEKFGTRKFEPHLVDAFAQEMASQTAGMRGRLGRSFAELPEWLAKIWRHEVNIAEFKDWRGLHGFDFFDGAAQGTS